MSHHPALAVGHPALRSYALLVSAKADCPVTLGGEPASIVNDRDLPQIGCAFGSIERNPAVDNRANQGWGWARLMFRVRIVEPTQGLAPGWGENDPICEPLSAHQSSERLFVTLKPYSDVGGPCSLICLKMLVPTLYVSVLLSSARLSATCVAQ
jgi:hypothetical protein